MGALWGAGGCALGGESSGFIPEDELINAEIEDNELEDEGLVQARTFFVEHAAPLLKEKCAQCHNGQHSYAPGFLRSQPDGYDSLVSSAAVVDFDVPAASRLLVKGVHDGPAWQEAEKRDKLLPWLELEASVRREAERGLMSSAHRPVEGANEVSLANLGAQGAALFFDWTLETPQAVLGQPPLFRLDDLRVHAGEAPLHVAGPALVIWQGGIPQVDPVDRMADIDVEIPAREQQVLAGGSYALYEEPEEGISFLFTIFAPAAAAGDSSTDGGFLNAECGRLDLFRSAMVDQLSPCATACHGAGGRAVGSLSMALVTANATDSDLANACAQVLLRTNPDDPESSLLLARPRPSEDNTHPYQFNNDDSAYQTYATSALEWIRAEAEVQ